MADIQFEIQGQDAVEATEELFSISGLSGNWETEGEADKEGTLITIGTIVAIVGGTVAIAEQIRKWYKEYKQGKSGKKIEKVLIQGRNGRRLLLENATLEQIKFRCDGYLTKGHDMSYPDNPQNNPLIGRCKFCLWQPRPWG
jgi:hypothetical protein